MPTMLELEIAAQLGRLDEELDRRVAEHERLVPYAKRTKVRPIPAAITAAKLTRSYLHLMSLSEMPWGKLVVASKLDRLEVNGVTSPEQSVSDAVWELVWQGNAMDLESKLGHRAALLDGRAHATVWPRSDWMLDGAVARGSADGPRVQLDDAATVVVEYAEGSRRDRVGALRRWQDERDKTLATLYRRDGIYKFRRSTRQIVDVDTFQAGTGLWERREVEGEPWPLPNPLRVVPVVEIAVNRELAPGCFTVCTGEFANETGLMDRINMLTFLGLAVAISMSFPLRVLIGEPILRNEEGKAIPPFDAYIGGVAQFENPDAKLAEYKAADRSQLSIYNELAELASATSTPRHYFPVSGAIANVSAETIRAFEGPLHAAVNGSHKPSLGEGWEEVLRLGGRMLPDPVELSPRAALAWADHESRSLAERADAFSKLAASGLPWQASAEIALSLGQDPIRRYEAEQAGSALAQLITTARQPQEIPVAAVATNGNG